MNEEAVDLAPQAVRVIRIGAARVCRWTRGARQPGLFDPAPARGEAWAVQEAGLIEPLGEAGDLLWSGSFEPMARPDNLVDLVHGSLAVEERHDVERRDREKDDLLGKARRIAEGYEALAILLDREGFERP